MDENYKLIYEKSMQAFEEYNQKKEELTPLFEKIVEYLQEKFPCIDSISLEIHDTFVNIKMRISNSDDELKLHKYLKSKGRKELGYQAYYSAPFGGKIQFRVK